MTRKKMYVIMWAAENAEGVADCGLCGITDNRKHAEEILAEQEALDKDDQERNDHDLGTPIYKIEAEWFHTPA